MGNNEMETPVNKKRNLWVLPGLVLWGFAPAIFMTTIPLIGSGLSDLAIPIGLYSAPFILWAWSAVILARNGVDWAQAIWRGIPLAFLMCLANAIVGVAGCTIVMGWIGGF